MMFVTKIKSVGTAQVLALSQSGSNLGVQIFSPEYLDFVQVYGDVWKVI
jgi:hypothetical protein